MLQAAKDAAGTKTGRPAGLQVKGIGKAKWDNLRNHTESARLCYELVNLAVDGSTTLPTSLSVDEAAVVEAMVEPGTGGRTGDVGGVLGVGEGDGGMDPGTIDEADTSTDHSATAAAAAAAATAGGAPTTGSPLDTLEGFRPQAAKSGDWTAQFTKWRDERLDLDIESTLRMRGVDEPRLAGIATQLDLKKVIGWSQIDESVRARLLKTERIEDLSGLNEDTG